MTARRSPVLIPSARFLLAIALLVAASACGGNDNTTPTTPTSPSTPARTAAAASVTEQFTGTLPVNGARFYAFQVGEYGTVNITLDRVGGGPVPASVWVGLGLGVPEGTDCSTTSSLNTQAGAGPQISSVQEAGTYCARIYDIGNLGAPAAFAVTIAHP